LVGYLANQAWEHICRTWCPLNRIHGGWPTRPSAHESRLGAGAWLCYEGADTTRFYCKNCWTCLLADHPAYGGVVCASQAMANLSGAELMDKQGRHYMRDLSDDQATALEKGMPWKGDSANLYQGVSQNFLDKLPDVLAAGKKGEKMNCQILLEKCGPALIPTDDPTLRGPPSFMEQVAAEKK